MPHRVALCVFWLLCPVVSDDKIVGRAGSWNFLTDSCKFRTEKIISPSSWTLRPIGRCWSLFPWPSARHQFLHCETTDTGPVHCAVCLFMSQLSPVLIAPTHGGMARLSWPGWLVTYRDIHPSKYYPGLVLINFVDTINDATNWARPPMVKI